MGRLNSSANLSSSKFQHEAEQKVFQQKDKDVISGRSMKCLTVTLVLSQVCLDCISPSR